MRVSRLSTTQRHGSHFSRRNGLCVRYHCERDCDGPHGTKIPSKAFVSLPKGCLHNIRHCLVPRREEAGDHVLRRPSGFDRCLHDAPYQVGIGIWPCGGSPGLVSKQPIPCCLLLIGGPHVMGRDRRVTSQTIFHFCDGRRDGVVSRRQDICMRLEDARPAVEFQGSGVGFRKVRKGDGIKRWFNRGDTPPCLVPRRTLPRCGFVQRGAH